MNKLMGKREFFFLAVILLVGLLTVPSYGACLDQRAQQRIMFGNIREYLLHFPGETPTLANDMGDAGVLEISIDEDRDHGMACFYPVFWIWYVNKTSTFAGSLIWQSYNFLLVFWGICSLYLLGKELFHSKKIAAFTALLFFLSPRMFAESHYNNKDVILLSLSFTMFYWCLQLMKKTSWKSVFMFAFTGALAFNSRILGACIFGALGLYALLYFIAMKKFNAQILAKTLGCIALWALLYILMTPATWSGIIEYFQYILYYAVNYDLWHDYVLFGGRMVHRDYTGIPRKYLPVMIIITTPVLILVMTAAGACVSARDIIKSRLKNIWSDAGYVFVILLIGFIPACYAMLAATPLYNGWRHLYFIYASMIVLSGYGCFKLSELLKKHGKQRIGVVCGTIYLIVLAAGIAAYYPNEHSYYNFLAGDDVLDNYELDYWDVSVKQALDVILEREGTDNTISVGALNYPTKWGITDQLEYYRTGQKQAISVEEDWKDSEYIIINTTYAVMYNQEEYEFVRENYQLISDFSSYGNIICEVWQK